MKSVVLKMEARSSKAWTAEQMLEDALADLRAGKRVANKALVIFLNTEDKEYSTGFSMAQLSATESIALMRVMEAHFLRMILDL